MSQFIVSNLSKIALIFILTLATEILAYPTDSASLHSIAPPKPLMQMPGILLVAGRPVLGSKVYLLAASPQSPGSPSWSLMGASLSGRRDEVGSFVSADDRGSFVVEQSRPCAPGALVYVYAHGGHRYRRPENPLIGLLSVIGKCSRAGVVVPDTSGLLIVSERTTASASYVLAKFGPDVVHITMSLFPPHTTMVER